jgi:hypothetical protein
LASVVCEKFHKLEKRFVRPWDFLEKGPGFFGHPPPEARRKMRLAADRSEPASGPGMKILCA